MIKFIALLFSSSAFAATITVDTLTDEDLANASCSLREALIAANDDSAYNGCDAGSGADLISFVVEGTIVLDSDLPFVTDIIEVAGPGADRLTIDGASQYKIFDVEDLDGNGPFLFSAMTLTRGLSNSGPAIRGGTGQALEVRDVVMISNLSTNDGGAISVFGNNGLPASITLERVALIDNEAQGPSSGGALRAGNVEVRVNISDSLFSGNRASHVNGNGGGMLVFGSSDVHVTIHNTTFSGNQANDGGGGLKLVSLATATITDSTFTNNTANADNDGADGGGGISIGAGDVSITNSVVAGNFAPGTALRVDLENTAFLSGGFNFIGDNTGSTGPFPEGNPNINGDYVGIGAAPLDPQLESLADNGGFTQSHLPNVASALIDAGSCTGSAGDQRGYGDPVTRVRIVDSPGVADVDDGCDVGAVEALAEPPPSPFIFSDSFETLVP